MAANTTGAWSSLLAWPIVGIHAVITPDGKLLTFGQDPNATTTSALLHDIWDPVTGEHHLIDHTMTTPTDIFCSTAVLVPGTDQIMIIGGTSAVNGHPGMGTNEVNLLDPTTHQVTPIESMTYGRWYATSVSLPTGQILAVGGWDQNSKFVPIPEIYTPGQGWRSLTGASDPDMGWYPRMFVNGDGKVVYFSTTNGTNSTFEVMLLDPTGMGSLKKIGELPFSYDWQSPAIQYSPGKVLISDNGGKLWTMDLSTGTPVFKNVGALATDHNYANMTVLADGEVLITGGTSSGNSDAFSDKTAIIWNPKTNALTETVDEINPRNYHASAILLPDGTVLPDYPASCAILRTL